MKLRSLLTAFVLLAGADNVTAKKKNEAEEYVYGKDPKKDAEYDIQMGMAGIQQAAKDPKLLAQLFQDMQVRRIRFGVHSFVISPSFWFFIAFSLAHFIID